MVLLFSGVSLARTAHTSSGGGSATTVAALTAVADLQTLFAQPANCVSCTECTNNTTEHTASLDATGGFVGAHATCIYGNGDQCPHPKCAKEQAATAGTSEALAELTGRVQRGSVSADELTQGAFADSVRPDEDGGIDVMLPCDPSVLLARISVVRES